MSTLFKNKIHIGLLALLVFVVALGALFLSAPKTFAVGGGSITTSGGYSFIGGGVQNSITSVRSAILGGTGNMASGSSSFIGASTNSTALGHYSFVGGSASNSAQSYAESVFGTFGTTYTPSATDSFNSADRIFNIANGQSGARSDAFTILKSGTTSVGIDNLESNGTGELFQVAGTSRLNSLNINGNYVFPTTDGSGGDVLSTDGNGNVDFTDPNTLNTSPELYEENQVNTFNPTVTGNNSVAVGGGSQTEHESSGTDSFVAGGYGNTASGSQSGVYVGYNNVAANSQSVVVGGRESTASARGAIVAGGSGNEATARESGTFAGDGNTATSEHATAVGGSSNDATADDSSVVGGTLNLASGQKSAILGSRNSESSGEESAVVGGSGHTASGLESAVLGGNGANVSGERSVAAAGNGNDVNSDDTFVSGQNNTANGLRGFIAGGNQNSITGANAFAQGKEVTAPSFSEAVFGIYPTDYIAQSSFAFNSGDRVFNVGNGVSGSRSDAFTVLKSGTTSVGVDNLEGSTAYDRQFNVNGTALAEGLMLDSQNRIPMRSPGANTLALGDGTTALSTLVLGNGQSNSSPVSKSKIQGTIASGTDVSGSDLEYVAGAGTGNAEPGIHRFLTSTKLSSGNTQQNTSLAFRIEDTRVNSFKSFDVNSNYVDFANMSAPSNANTNEGRMFLDSSDNKLKASEDGELYEPVLNNYKKLGSIAITSVATTNEVTLYSYTVDAGSLEGENVLETKVDISDFDLTSGESATLRAKFGGTTVASVEINNDTGAAFTDHTGTIKARLVASGTTNQQGAIEANFSNGGSYEDDHAYAQDSGSTGLDTTNDQTLEITAELTSGGSAGNSIASTIGEAKLIQ